MDLGGVIDTSSPGVHFTMLESVPTGRFSLGGVFYCECWDKWGRFRWRDWAKNILPVANLNDILNTYFGGGSQIVTWYMGMVDNAGFSAFSASDTSASHPGWSENTNCSNSSRPAWTPGAASSGSMSNPSATVFNMNPAPTCTIKGFFLSQSNTLGGTSGMLSAEAALTSPQVFNNGDTGKVSYSIIATTS